MENEALNQVEVDTLNEALDGESNADEDLFADSIIDEPEASNEPTNDSEEAKEEVETPNEPEKESPFLEVEFLKEIKGLTKEEAVTLSQKGLNYERMMKRYYDPIDELARANGMDVNTFIDSLKETQRQVDIDKEMNSLRETRPNDSEESLKEIAEARVLKRYGEMAQKVEQEKQEQVNAQENAVKRDVETLKTEFPDLDINNLPEEVFGLVKDGHNLVSAYYKYLHNQDMIKISQAEEKSKIDAINEANKKKSLGNTSNAGEGEKEDDFFIGLNSI